MVSPGERLSGSQNMVIMGCDDLGASVATALSEQGHVVHVLDSRSEAFERLPPGKVEDGRIVPFLGTGTLQGDRDPDIPGAGEDLVGAQRELVGFPDWPRFPLRVHGPHDAQPYRVGNAAKLGQDRLEEVGFLRRAGNRLPLEQHRHVRMSASGRTCQCLCERSSSPPVRVAEVSA